MADTTSSIVPIDTTSSIAPVNSSSSTTTDIILDSDKNEAKNIMITTIILNIVGFILICISIYLFIQKRNLNNIMIFIVIFYVFLIPANLIMTGLYFEEANNTYEEILKKINDKPEVYSISKWKAKQEHKTHYLYNIYTSFALSAVFLILIIIFKNYEKLEPVRVAIYQPVPELVPGRLTPANITGQPVIGTGAKIVTSAEARKAVEDVSAQASKLNAQANRNPHKNPQDPHGIRTSEFRGSKVLTLAEAQERAASSRV